LTRLCTIQQKELVLDISNLEAAPSSLPPLPYPYGLPALQYHPNPTWPDMSNSCGPQPQQSLSYPTGFESLPPYVPPHDTPLNHLPNGFSGSLVIPGQDPSSLHQQWQCSQPVYPSRYEQGKLVRHILPPPSALVAPNEALTMQGAIGGQAYYDNNDHRRH